MCSRWKWFAQMTLAQMSLAQVSQASLCPSRYCATNVDAHKKKTQKTQWLSSPQWPHFTTSLCLQSRQGRRLTCRRDVERQRSQLLLAARQDAAGERVGHLVWTKLPHGPRQLLTRASLTACDGYRNNVLQWTPAPLTTRELSPCIYIDDNSPLASFLIYTNNSEEITKR